MHEHVVGEVEMTNTGTGKAPRVPSGRACHFERSREISRATLQIHSLPFREACAAPARTSTLKSRQFSPTYQNGGGKVKTFPPPFWRGWRDLNSRCSFPHYSLSRGAP